MYQTNLRANQSLFFSFNGLLSCELAKGHRGDISKGRILGSLEVLKPNKRKFYRAPKATVAVH